MLTRLGDEMGSVWCTLGLAEALHYAGDRVRSRRVFVDGLVRAVAHGERRAVAYALSHGGVMALDEGDHEQAAVFVATALHTRSEKVGQRVRRC